MLLGIDTSTLTLSLALVRRDGDAFVDVERVEVGPPKKQSEILPGAVGELLARHSLKVKDLEGIAVGLGPGSFTGLRIGLSTVKALAYAAQLKVSGVSSLAAAAADGPENVPLFVIAVARVNDLYLGRYRRSGAQVEKLGEEEALSPEELKARLDAEPTAILIGPAAFEYGPKLVGLGLSASRVQNVGAVPSASALVRLASFPAAYDEKAVFALEPHYIRSSGAEMNPKFPPLPGVDPVARIKQD